MDEVFPRLFVGDALDARDHDRQDEHRIGAVLSLLRVGPLFEDEPSARGGVELRRAPLIDREGNDPGEFIRAIRALEDLAGRHPRVLVHCYAGQIRSAGIAAAYMVRRRPADIDAALEGLPPGQRSAIDAAAHADDERHYPEAWLRDPTFQRLAKAFRAMRARRPIVRMYPPMWLDVYPKVRDFLAGSR